MKIQVPAAQGARLREPFIGVPAIGTFMQISESLGNIFPEFHLGRGIEVIKLDRHPFGLFSDRPSAVFEKAVARQVIFHEEGVPDLHGGEWPAEKSSAQAEAAEHGFGPGESSIQNDRKFRGDSRKEAHGRYPFEWSLDQIAMVCCLSVCGVPIML
jgi:hypothetical protein